MSPLTRKTHFIALTIAVAFAAKPASAGGLVVSANAPMEDIVTGVLRFALALVSLLMMVSIGHAWLLVDGHGGNEEKKAAAYAAFRDAILGFTVIVAAGYAAPSAVRFGFAVLANNGIII